MYTVVLFVLFYFVLLDVLGGLCFDLCFLFDLLVLCLVV